MSYIVTSINLGEEAVISTRQKRKHIIPPFTPLGKAGMTKHKIEGFATGTKLKNLSSAATWLFWTLDEKRHPNTNIAILESQSLSSYEKSKVVKAVKELTKANLVKRVKKETYLINPKAVLPQFEFFQDVWTEWEQLP